ncbi:MAG: FAD binding domain-containing protein, partial [Actinoallomurus sp.]
DDGAIVIGAGLPYSRVIAELGAELPALATASRTVGSPQIRNRGTVGGNLGAASPAGDSHPPLLAGDAVIEVESVRGTRMIPATRFYIGVKKSALEPDELIRAFWMAPATGPQHFSKIGTRNAMVIAVCSFAVALHPDEGRVGTGIGSAAPTPLRATEAEEFLARELRWDGALDEAVAREFGALVAAAAAPIDDVRGTAGYRRHALSVMARRTLTWAWNDHRTPGRGAA